MPIISRVRLSVPAGSDAPSGNADSAIFRESSLITTTRRRRPTLVPTRSVGTRGKPPPDPCSGKADVKRAVVLSEDSPSFRVFPFYLMFDFYARRAILTANPHQEVPSGCSQRRKIGARQRLDSHHGF